MTDPTPTDALPVQSPPPPFSDQALFPITKPINLGQLSDEIQAALHRQVSVAQVGPANRAPISTDNPAELAVSPGDVDAPTVTQTITDHTPREGYGVPAHVQDFDELLTRVANAPDQTLASADIELGLRGLLIREAGRRSIGVPTVGLMVT